MKNSNRDIFSFQSYRDYLQIALPVKGEERGSRTKLAEFLGCQSGFISQVMSGLADFSFEHAMKVSRFLGHTKEETHFFLLLVHHARAGSKELREHYSEEIKAILDKRRDIRERVSAGKQKMSEGDKLLYYSSWHHAAIHMCLVNGATQTKKSVAEYLKIPVDIVGRVLGDLVSIGLAVQEGDLYVGKYDRLHLPADSPLISKHHTNWRMRAIHSLDNPQPSSLHYSLVMSVSHEAAEKMRTMLLNTIQEMEPVLREAKDEAVYALAMDLFDLRG